MTFLNGLELLSKLQPDVSLAGGDEYMHSIQQLQDTLQNRLLNEAAQDIFKARGIDDKLLPYKVMRECRDSDEHPHTIPVVLALDVTGSMGTSIAEVAKRLNEVMTKLYSEVPDVEFCIMGIGDLAYDQAPIQISQFEADVRIAEWLDKVYFEKGGGGNAFESYTAAWFMGVHHMDLDCWKRGEKGVIITLGDEPLNPYLPKERLERSTGDIGLQADIETGPLFNEACQKFDIYHIAVDGGFTNCYERYKSRIEESFGEYLDGQRLMHATIEEVIPTIIDIVKNHVSQAPTAEGMPVISW